MATLEGSEAHLSRHLCRGGCNHKLALVVKVAIDDAIVTDEAVALEAEHQLRRARGTSSGKRRHREPRSPLIVLAPPTHAPVTSCSLAIIIVVSVHDHAITADEALALPAERLRLAHSLTKLAQRLRPPLRLHHPLVQADRAVNEERRQ